MTTIQKEDTVGDSTRLCIFRINRGEKLSSSKKCLLRFGLSLSLLFLGWFCSGVVEIEYAKIFI